jgi:WD40 repeat protein
MDCADSFILVTWAFYAPEEIAVAAGSSGNVIRSLDYQPTSAYRHEPRFPLNDVAVAPKSPLLAVAVGGDHDQIWDNPRQGEVVLWNFLNGEEQLRFHSTNVAFSALAFSPDGRFLAAAGGSYAGVKAGREVYRGEVRSWEVATGRLVFETDAPTSLLCIAFSPEARTIVAGGIWGTVRFYQATDGREYDSYTFAPLEGTARSYARP